MHLLILWFPWRHPHPQWGYCFILFSNCTRRGMFAYSASLSTSAFPSHGLASWPSFTATGDHHHGWAPLPLTITYRYFNLGPIVFLFIPSPAPTDEPSNALASQRPDLPNSDTLHLVLKFKLGCLYLTWERNKSLTFGFLLYKLNLLPKLCKWQYYSQGRSQKGSGAVNWPWQAGQ